MRQTEIQTIDTADIAKMLGCTRNHVTDRLTKQTDFPAPVINLSSRLRRWKLSDVVKFITKSN